RPSKVPVPDNVFTNMMGDVANQGRSKWVAAETRLLLLRIEVALYQFKADTGRFSTTLDQLIPAYIKTIPPDPFGGSSGGPLHYSVRQMSPGFLLYSVGADMTDNGGISGRYPDSP